MKYFILVDKDPLLQGLGEEVGKQPMSFIENIGKTLVHSGLI